MRDKHGFFKLVYEDEVATEVQNGSTRLDNWSVVLTGVGPDKFNVIKAVRDVTGLGLSDAIALVDGAPKAIKADISPEEIAKIKKRFEDVGATVEVEHRQ